MSECTHDCSSCGENCESRQQPQSFLEEPGANSHIKKVIGVVSGKGGVGKSLVTAMLAVTMRRREASVGVLDADITGPSMPQVFGLHEKAQGSEFGILPVETKSGIRVMSVNLLLEQEDAPVVWRGPVIGNTVKQFWTDVVWQDVDYLFVDMPPGTGDVPLTVFQSLPVDGIVVVASPQELVGMIVAKAVNMAKIMNIPIVGIVENMSYFQCPDCGKKVKIFGDSHVEENAAKYGLNVIGRIPIDPSLARQCDAGEVELFEGDYLEAAADAIEAL
ncbi:Mrp/NBP35 family ATP-binding protein [Feifania hominis]|uniref:Iron-sulfur cluster carrier protein n=1 Tax=Feifania hominis TaxID=2763660 RepID=A0A926HU19_9FIRM|nr:Mrp/NBP35 family ATP-binding protein [Feifania hominis]MBC8536449.1 Mrp/NBP35 family ATP-binding protein [Feifania hominis]